MVPSNLASEPEFFDDADRAAVIHALLVHMPLVCSTADARLAFSVMRYVVTLPDQRSAYCDGTDNPVSVSGVRVWMDCTSRPHRPPDAIVHWDEIAAMASGESAAQAHWF